MKWLVTVISIHFMVMIYSTALKSFSSFSTATETISDDASGNSASSWSYTRFMLLFIGSTKEIGTFFCYRLLVTKCLTCPWEWLKHDSMFVSICIWVGVFYPLLSAQVTAWDVNLALLQMFHPEKQWQMMVDYCCRLSCGGGGWGGLTRDKYERRWE